MPQQLIDRDALRQCLPDPVAVLRKARELGYVRLRFRNGLELIATQDGGDKIEGPTFSMRQASRYFAAWERLPLVIAK